MRNSLPFASNFASQKLLQTETLVQVSSAQNDDLAATTTVWRVLAKDFSFHAFLFRSFLAWQIHPNNFAEADLGPVHGQLVAVSCIDSTRLKFHFSIVIASEIHFGHFRWHLKVSLHPSVGT